ncbi:VanZ family protein [Aidingimonas lacisalsi]|uniref:VanZ family protein n=1 Tax=Aidingimonas lacisalsi TaxID=2604086 RepID=UPI001F44DD19|nr:VanZ family protein [Aidingimonas lacisalsi]
MAHWHAQRRLWTALAVAAAIVIAWGSLTPGAEMPERLPWDKLNHFVGYGGLAGLLGLAGWRLSRAFVVASLYGIAIECAQLPVPGRLGGDVLDIVANVLGAASATCLLCGLRWLARHD